MCVRERDKAEGLRGATFSSPFPQRRIIAQERAGDVAGEFRSGLFALQDQVTLAAFAKDRRRRHRRGFRS
jgi:hypothetical protein